ncbi:hypothetical protein MtrunA17_Chr6g0472021 [Medicago truncatula]|uniref:Transmembrane protein n=1 Tax=Medicago truncatula TaxID=3880 RepID=A0A396HGK8_MEDTR|nr:hypothetical protein MtrunA17_Chr6g0472021 [Medicago truncatula]
MSPPNRFGSLKPTQDLNRTGPSLSSKPNSEFVLRPNSLLLYFLLAVCVPLFILLHPTL